MKRPDRFPRKSDQPGRFPFTDLRLMHVMMNPVRSGLTGVVVRVESLRGMMGESTRGVEGLFESLLSQSFSG